MTAAECGHAARCTRPAGHRGHHGGFRPLALDRERLAAAINDAQIMGTEWWGRDLLPVAERIARLYEREGRA